MKDQLESNNTTPLDTVHMVLIYLDVNEYLNEVVHGCWEYSLASDETFCSECNYVIAEGAEYPIYNFCPNCGADMKGGKDE